jgi:hypothetical protein
MTLRQANAHLGHFAPRVAQKGLIGNSRFSKKT